jgi:hypothetical protein
MGEQAEPREEMPESLAKVCTRVIELFGRNDARDALDRYAIGCIIRDVRDSEQTYGQASVAKIARRIGRDVDTLYEYANVAETWSEVEVKRLLERKTAAGLPLSFTHLVVLSRLRRKRDSLKKLTDRALEGLSARHLRALVDEERRRGSRDPQPVAPEALLQRFVTCCDRLLVMSQSLDHCLSDLPAMTPSDKLVELLEKATESHRHLHQICQENARRLEQEYARACSQSEEPSSQSEEPEPLDEPISAASPSPP